MVSVVPNPASTARPHSTEQLLLPSMARAVCDEMGLNWWAAIKLHEDGWLTFSPETVTRLDESQEAELRFVGALVTAGCDRKMLAALLGGLPRPYAYHASHLYYDWVARHWRMLPAPDMDSESLFTEWLERLVEKSDVHTLAGIAELTQDALARVRHSSTQRELYANSRAGQRLGTASTTQSANG